MGGGGRTEVVKELSWRRRGRCWPTLGLGKAKGERGLYRPREAVWWCEKRPALGFGKPKFKTDLTHRQVANALTVTSACERVG